MRILLITLFIYSATLIGYSQNEIQSFVEKNSIAIKTIQPDSTDFSDLEEIGNAIGDARIVMLGEQDHGDAPTFLAKTRLINYLHAKKGFTVISFESDFFSSTYGFANNSKSKEEYLKYYKGNLVPYWTVCDACSYLFERMVPESFNSPNPYILAGFDDQVYYKYASANLSGTIDSLAKKSAVELLADDLVYNKLLRSIDTLSNPLTCATKSKEYYKASIALLSRLKKEFEAKLGIEDLSCVLTDNLIALAVQMLTKNDFTSMVNTRDVEMAATLKWLCTVKFPNEKIIVWAANYHISKFMGNFEKKSLNDGKSMATELVKDPVLNSKTYVLGFTSYDGDAGRLGTKITTVDKPGKNGFETWINSAFNYAFTDFKKFNELNPSFNESFELKSCVTDDNVHKSYPAQWNKMFDGIFFIRHMYACQLKR